MDLVSAEREICPKRSPICDRYQAMRWAIFSDIHGNMPALEAVLASIEEQSVDQLLCLGDLVGYGAQPHEVVERVRELDCTVIVGNHDLAAIGKLDTSCFNAYAQEAVQWTADQLTDDDRSYLDSLPLKLDVGPISAVHGTRDEPDEFHYLQSLDHAQELLDEQPRFLGVYGHTHVPLSFLQRCGRVTLSFAQELDLSTFERVLVNVGSVGQPRDEDSRAAYVLFDAETRQLTIHRVEYDIESAVSQILAAGLPTLLAERLRHGV